MPLQAVELSSSLPLQQLLHYNALYSFAYSAAQISSMVYKHNQFVKGEEAIVILQPILFSIWVLAELGRLRLGYVGNLTQKVPELSAFILLSLFPTLPFIGVLTFGLWSDVLPLDKVIGWPMVAFLILELVFAWRTVRKFINKQTAEYFRLVQTHEQQERSSNVSPTGSLLQHGFQGIQREASNLATNIIGSNDKVKES